MTYRYFFLPTYISTSTSL